MKHPAAVALTGLGVVFLASAPGLLRAATPQAAPVQANRSQGDSAEPRFEVVSVKLDVAGTGGAGDRFPRNGRWHWTRAPLSFLIMYAYDVSLSQVANIPNSFQERDMAFDIDAKVPPNVTDAQFRAMLRSMLADRFHFASHREMRDLPVNTVEVAKEGHKLRPATGECVTVPQSINVEPGQFRCGEVTLRYDMREGISHQRYSGRSASVRDLVATLSSNGPVIDDTGIAGVWDIDVDIEFMPHQRSDDPDETANNTFEYQRTVRAAFEKQLGLIYDPGKIKKRPMPVIVVDRVERPTAN